MKNFFASLMTLQLLVIVLVLAWTSTPHSRVEVALDIPALAEVQTPVFTEREVRCLTQMIYSEAGGEVYAGKVAVAASAVTRSLKAQWPDDLCKVVNQKNQFTTRATLRKLNDIERKAWAESRQAAIDATQGYGALPASYRRSVFFSSGKGAQFTAWADVVGKVGNHTFYEARA